MSDSLYTKKLIANGFKSLMEKKPFEKITISDITSVCGLNRQTFYYHFKDKYELLNWIYYNEAIILMLGEESFENWEKTMLEMLTVIKNDAKFYANALNTEYGNEFRDYMFLLCTQIFDRIIEKVIGDNYLENEDKKFISEFYSYGISGSIIKWIKSGMKSSPESFIRHMKNIVNDSRTLSLGKFSQK